MGWVRLDDQFYDHPKFAQAGPLGLALWVTALAWSNRNLTDGFVPTSAIKRLVDFDGVAWGCWMGEHFGGGDDAEPIDVAAHLVKCRLLEEVDGGYLIHDYHDFQPAADEVLAKRAKERERWQRRFGGGSSAVDSAVDSPPETTPNGDGGHSAVDSARTPRVPNPKSSSTKNVSAKGYSDEFEAVWSMYPRKEGKRAAFNAWRSLVRRVDAEAVALAVKHYAEKCRHTEARFIKLGSTFFGPNDHYLDHLEPPRKAVGDVYDDGGTEYR